MEQVDEEFEETTIRGFVVADDWDDDNEVVSVAVSTDDGDEYLVTRRGLGKDLLDHVDDYVEVVGVVHKDRYGDLSIDVTDFEVVTFD